MKVISDLCVIVLLCYGVFDSKNHPCYCVTVLLCYCVNENMDVWIDEKD